MPAKIAVVGSANIDFIMQLPRLPRQGETITGGRFMQTYGGKGANQAVAAARCGAEVTFVAALGGDVAAHAYLDQLQAEGIATEHIALEPDVPGGSALVMFDKQGENYLGVAPGSNLRVTPERVKAAEQVIAACDWLVLQQEIPTAAIDKAIKLANSHGRPVMMNHAPAHPDALLPNPAINLLVVNETEASALAGVECDASDIAAVQALAESLRTVGTHAAVVITLGKAGSVYAEASGVGRTPAFVVDAVDSTAAGDTFCGGLVVALGEGASMPKAVRFASAASALSVTRMGAQSSIPSRREIEEFLRKRQQVT